MCKATEYPGDCPFGFVRKLEERPWRPCNDIVLAVQCQQDLEEDSKESFSQED